MPTETSSQTAERAFIYRILRYTPNLVRDEWLNIGVLVYDPATGERRLRVIEEEAEYTRVRRLLPKADESLLRRLRDDLEDRLVKAGELFNASDVHAAENGHASWQKLLQKWDQTLANVLQLAEQKGVYASDLDTETERVYSEKVAIPRKAPSVGAPGTRASVRSYCNQVWKQAHLWGRIDKGVRVEKFTFPGDPMHIDFGYRSNGTRGFAQALSVSRSPGDARDLAYAVQHIRSKISSSEFTAVTDVPLAPENKRHNFVRETLRDVGVEIVSVDGFARWVNQKRPTIH
jgi:hypothetical protein